MSVKIPWGEFSEKHKKYINGALKNRMCVAEGAIRSGKTIDHCIIAAAYLEQTHKGQADGQGSRVCCSPQGHKEAHTT